MDSFFEELEKKRKRRELRKKIEKLEKEINSLNETKESYNSHKKAINTKLEIWEGQCGFYDNIELTPDIEKKDMFEGFAAEAFAADLPEKYEWIRTAADKMKPVVAGICEQVSKIEEYVAELEQRKALLKAELEAI